jgi:cytochrome c5
MIRVTSFLACAGALVVAIGARGAVLAQTPSPQASPPAAAAAPPAGDAARQRALLDKYCVTCHNDRVKTANLSLQSADLARRRITPSCGRR